MAEKRDCGTLYVVGTPIGNLGDITLRAVDVLKRVRIVAAEDTRRSRVLLDHIGAHPQNLVSLHEHNEADRCPGLLDELQQGHDVALVSDAGTPLVSDPGFLLVRRCWETGVGVIPVPGPSAITAVLSISPIPLDGFLFVGFLPARAGQRRELLRQLRSSRTGVVFFEAPHRVLDMLRDLVSEVGAERRVFVAKELTKVHERALFGAAHDVLGRLGEVEKGERGEFVCVMEGSHDAALEGAFDARRLMDTLLQELKPAQAARVGAKLTGAPRAELYAYAVGRGKPDSREGSL